MCAMRMQQLSYPWWPMPINICCCCCCFCAKTLICNGISHAAGSAASRQQRCSVVAVSGTGAATATGWGRQAVPRIFFATPASESVVWQSPEQQQQQHNERLKARTCTWRNETTKSRRQKKKKLIRENSCINFSVYCDLTTNWLTLVASFSFVCGRGRLLRFVNIKEKTKHPIGWWERSRHDLRLQLQLRQCAIGMWGMQHGYALWWASCQTNSSLIKLVIKCLLFWK